MIMDMIPVMFLQIVFIQHFDDTLTLKIYLQYDFHYIPHKVNTNSPDFCSNVVNITRNIINMFKNKVEP